MSPYALHKAIEDADRRWSVTATENKQRILFDLLKMLVRHAADEKENELQRNPDRRI